MKIFSALFDAALIPVAVAVDFVTVLPRLSGCDTGPSYTRLAIERVERDLGL